jgi:hypothetical protein
MYPKYKPDGKQKSPRPKGSRLSIFDSPSPIVESGKSMASELTTELIVQCISARRKLFLMERKNIHSQIKKPR